MSWTISISLNPSDHGQSKYWGCQYPSESKHGGLPPIQRFFIVTSLTVNDPQRSANTSPTLSFGRSPPRYGLTLCPFTLKSLSPFGVISSTAPWGDTLLTKNGPDHFDLSFTGNSFNLELYNKTSYPTLISLDACFCTSRPYFFDLRCF